MTARHSLDADGLVTNALRLRAFFTKTFFLVRFVLLIIPVEESHFRVTFERQNVYGGTVRAAGRIVSISVFIVTELMF